MYGFHYNLIKKKFDIDLLFTDTDSLTQEIKPKDVYKSKFFDSTNKKVIGKMKDEFKGIPNNKFIGLKCIVLFGKTERSQHSKGSKYMN